MKELFLRLFVSNWQRKLVAILAAVIIWFLVYQSMTISRTLPDVPVRITNLAIDKTVEGLLPNGQLKKRVPITVTGRKSIIEEIRPGDVEVVINGEGRKESWIASIDKKNLISLVPNLNLQKYLTDISAPDIYIKLSPIMTEEISVTIRKPVGEPPRGYQFLDIWPKILMQTVSGPKEQVEALKKRGIELTFNLQDLSKEELDRLHQAQGTNESDEVSYFVPNTWKEVPIPFRDNALEALNDPRSKFLRIDFLHTELLPLSAELSIAIFFPLQTSKTLNPETLSLSMTDLIAKKNGIPILAIPLLVKDVSRLFLDVVKNNLQIVIIASQKSSKKSLNWTLEIIGQEELEDEYVKRAQQEKVERPEDAMLPKLREEYLRYRFRTYALQMRLYTQDEQKFLLTPQIQGKYIILNQGL